MHRTDGRAYHIGICGSYGGLNLGDEAILEAIVRELRRRVPVRVHVFSRNPEDTLARHDVEDAVGVRLLSRADVERLVRPLDLLIVGGGGILFDGEASTFLRPMQIAQKLGVSTMTWAVGVGPLQVREDRIAVRRALDAAELVTVRDVNSRLLLEELGVKRDVEVTSDPALLLEPEPMSEAALVREGIEPNDRVIGMSIRERGPAAPELDAAHYHNLLANAVDFLTDRMDSTVLFVPMEPQDMQHAHRVAARVNNVQRLRILHARYSPREVRGLMPRLELAIGMRLHFLIFAASAGVPFACLPYSAKVAAFADAAGMPSVPFGNAGQLLAGIDRAWDLRSGLRNALGPQVQALKAQVGQTADRVVGLLRSRPTPQAAGPLPPGA